MNTFRVFLTRHFVDVCYFDVEAPTQRKAVNAAIKAAYMLRNGEQSRRKATDNGWIPDNGIVIEQIGHPNPQMYKMSLFQEDEKNDVKIYLSEVENGRAKSTND